MNSLITCAEGCQLINTEIVRIRRRDGGGLRENVDTGRVGAVHDSGEGQVFVASVTIHCCLCDR